MVGSSSIAASIMLNFPGTTIIIFEDSQTGAAEDTLICARQEVETRWVRQQPSYCSFLTDV